MTLDRTGVPGEVKFDGLYYALKFPLMANITAGQVCIVADTGGLMVASAASTGKPVVPLQHGASGEEVTGMLEGVVLLKSTAVAKKGTKCIFGAAGAVSPKAGTPTFDQFVGYYAEDCTDITIPVAVRVV